MKLHNELILKLFFQVPILSKQVWLRNHIPNGTKTGVKIKVKVNKSKVFSAQKHIYV